MFEVDWSIESHQLTDGRYLLRCDDKNMPFAAGDIETLKKETPPCHRDPVYRGHRYATDPSLLRNFAYKLGLKLRPRIFCLGIGWQRGEMVDSAYVGGAFGKGQCAGIHAAT